MIMSIQEYLKSNFEISDGLADKVARLFDHLPVNVGNNDLLLLKGHLLVEEVLNELVEKVVPQPNSIKSAKLSYHQVLKIAESIYFQQDRQWMWGASEKLNKIRNLLSHNLEPKKLGEEINDFIFKCTPSYVKNEGVSIDLKTALICLYTGMASNLEFDVKLDLTRP